ncbi:PAS domain S-box protein [Ramlibacter sp. WS9]|uniref:PAS domain-containing hybrid sensor histidine kinase/response regulator n=1 Tax=Ramlibacter sp. WS9 TaxID=1882741 RepID=UPI001144F7B4|nr:PAS domain S-box protein [Ramlibacter sp. WS9]ROZ68979.1 PAS domain S-box protein [Ramlibacter sp. WS9]
MHEPNFLSDALAADLPLLTRVLDGVPVRVGVLDRPGRYHYANAAALEFLGLKAEELVGRTLLDVRGPEIQASWAPVAERVFAGETVTWEGWSDYVTRGRCFTEETLRPYRGSGGEVELVIAYARDLTDLKQQEQMLLDQVQALQRAEQLKAAIVDNALAAIVTTDAAGLVVEFNPAAEAMFGLSRAQALGRPVSEVIIPPRHRQGHQAGLDRMARGEEPRLMGQRLQLHALRADGTEFPIEMVLWQTQTGGQPYYTASINDMSEKVLAAEVIERQRDALRQSEKLSAMGSLLAGVAHELNNPLAIVMGRASLLEERTEGTPLHAEVRRIHDAAERCGRIVRTFLNMARQRPSERAPVLLNDLVRGAADLLQYSLRSSGVQLSLALAPELPEVSADADRLGQVVLNLIVNAQQALQGVPAPRELHIETGVDKATSLLWLRVSDNGPGVPDDMRERIFDPYFTTKGEGAGTGLGLPVSRSVARDHDGELLLEDRRAATDGRIGASFCLRLPLQPAPPSVPRAAPRVEAPAPAAQRLLVVDDEPEIADLMRAMLEGAGYDVITAESGAVALKMLDEGRFDAVISDLRMPDVDGAALWREVSERQPALAQRMLFVTGDTLSAGAQRFLADAGCGSLDKPFAKSDLLARVAALLKPK